MNRFAIAFAGAALVALAASPVSAQYPPPQGSIALTPSDPTPEVGETITINVVVSAAEAANLGEPGDVILASVPLGPEAGLNPLFQAPPYSCTDSVSGGTGATVTPSAFETDAAGAATLSVYTGTTPATLTVSVDCGVASAQVLLDVGGGDDDGDDDGGGDDDGDGDDDGAGTGTATVPAGGATATAPSGGGGAGPTPRAPSTGTGDAGTGDGWMLATGGIAGLLIAGGAAYVALRAKGRRA